MAGPVTLLLSYALIASQPTVADEDAPVPTFDVACPAPPLMPALLPAPRVTVLPLAGPVMLVPVVPDSGVTLVPVL